MNGRRFCQTAAYTCSNIWLSLSLDEEDAAPCSVSRRTSNALGACFSGLNTSISRIYAYISEIKLKQSRLDKSAQTLRATVMIIMAIIHERNSCMYNVNETRGTYERNSSEDNCMTMAITEFLFVKILCRTIGKRFATLCFIIALIKIINGNWCHVRCVLSKVQNGNYCRGEFTFGERMFELKFNLTKTY